MLSHEDGSELCRSTGTSWARVDLASRMHVPTTAQRVETSHGRVRRARPAATPPREPRLSARLPAQLVRNSGRRLRAVVRLHEHADQRPAVRRTSTRVVEASADRLGGECLVDGAAGGDDLSVLRSSSCVTLGLAGRPRKVGASRNRCRAWELRRVARSIAGGNLAQLLAGPPGQEPVASSSEAG